MCKLVGFLTQSIQSLQQEYMNCFSVVTVQYIYTAVHQQELSYRKQIAHKLRIQYIEGIYRPKYYTVTLKSRLRVTQAHWKQNH